jgi:dihydroorotase
VEYQICKIFENLTFRQPNLVPPITKVSQALAYRAELQKLEPNVNFLMSLYLHEDITPDTIIEAKKAGITGVKSYPAGTTLPLTDQSWRY